MFAWAAWQYELRNPLVLALAIYLAGILLVVTLKPRAVWDERRKRYGHFGTGREETVYPLWAIALMLGVLCYSVSTVLYWVYGREWNAAVGSTTAAAARGVRAG